MKTAVSIPDPVFQSADRLAERLRVSRSELYARALKMLLESYRRNAVTAQLDAIYGDGGEDSSLPEDVAHLQSRTLPPGAW